MLQKCVKYLDKKKQSNITKPIESNSKFNTTHKIVHIQNSGKVFDIKLIF